MKDSDLAWFQPVWRRVAITAFCAAWTAFEWWNGDEFWGFVTLGLLAYCIWTFFISFKVAEKPAEPSNKPSEPPSPEG